MDREADERCASPFRNERIAVRMAERRGPFPVQENRTHITTPTPSSTCPIQRAHNTGFSHSHRPDPRHQRAWTRKRRNKNPSRKPVRQARKLQCMLSGFFLVMTLTIYLALIFSINNPPSSLHITFILALLLSLILFIHTLLRLCLLPKTHTSSRHHLPHHHHVPRRHRTRPSSLHITTDLPSSDSLYTPTTPIRVHLASDGDGDGDGAGAIDTASNPSEKSPYVTVQGSIPTPAPQAPPPAYGLWRCSVRADPNLLHWRRSPTVAGYAEAGCVEARVAEAGGRREMVQRTHPRPPSYADEDADEIEIGGRGRYATDDGIMGRRRVEDRMDGRVSLVGIGGAGFGDEDEDVAVWCGKGEGEGEGEDDVMEEEMRQTTMMTTRGAGHVHVQEVTRMLLRG